MTHLTKEHINYVIIRYHVMKVKITDIYTELVAPRLEGEAVNKYGIKPITKLSKNYFYRKIHTIDQDTIDQVKETWCNDLLEIPLANKKVRILKLVDILNGETDGKVQNALLKSIKEEVGEQDWIEATKESGTKVTVIGGMTTGMMKQIASVIMEETTEIVDEDDEDDEAE